MPSIDNRVVNMLFQNEQFEKGAKQTIDTLDTLEKKLKLPDSDTAFTKITAAANAVNLTGIRSGIETISDRFSNLGIIGMTVLQNLTNSAVNLGKKILTAIPNQIVSGGKTRALNIEQAKFQLEGLGVAWEDIYDNIDKAVLGTAYGLDEAAKVASQLAASGVAYGDANSDMAHALRGISGVAAMTNSSYEDIGSIFTTVAGQGKLMTYQLRQLESRGLNAAAKLGEALGYTESEIREMVTDGKISFLTFANAMDECFGEHATKANETFTGALSNMKAALSRIGADFATPIMNLGKDTFNALRVSFDKVRKLIDNNTKSFAEGSFTKLTTVLSEIIPSIISKWDYSALSGFIGIADKVAGSLSKFLEVYKIFTMSPKDRNSFLEELKNTEGGERTLYIYERLKNIISPLNRAFTNLKGVINSVFVAVKDAWKVIFPPSTANKRFKTISKAFAGIANSISDATEKIREFFSNEKRAAKLQSVFQGLFAIADLAKQAIEGLWRGAKLLLEPLLGKIEPLADGLLNGAGSLGEWLTMLDQSAKESDFFGNTFVKIATWILNAADNIKKAFETVKGALETAWNWFLDNIWSKIGPTVESIWGHLQEFWKGFKQFISNIVDGSNVQIDFSGIGNFFTWLGENINWDLILDGVGKFFEFAGTLLNGVLGLVNSLLGGDADGAADSIDTLCTALTAFAGIEIGTALVAGAGGILGFLESLSVLMSSVTAQWNVGIIESIAKSIGILAASLIFLSMVDQNDLDKALGALIAVTSIMVAAYKILTYTKQVGDKAEGAANGVESATKGIASLKNSLTGFIDTMQGKLAARLVQGSMGSVMTKLAISILILVAAVAILALVPTEKLMGAVTAVIFMLIAMVWAIKSLMKSMDGLDVESYKNIKKLTGMIGKIAIAILIMSASVKLLSTIDIGTMWSSVGAVLAMMIFLVLAVEIMGSLAQNGEHSVEISYDSLKAFSNMLIKIAIAILIMSASVKLLSTIDIGTMWSSVGAVVVMLAALVGAIAVINLLAKKGEDSAAASASTVMGMAFSMVIIALAVSIMAASVKSLSKVEDMSSAFDAVLYMLIGLTAAIAILGVLSKSEVSTGPILGMAASMVVVAIAVSIVAGAIKKISGIDPSALENSLWDLVIIMGAMAAVLVVLNAVGGNSEVGGGKMLAMAASILIMAVAIRLLAPAIQMLGNMGMAAFTGVLAVTLALMGLAAVGLLLTASGAIVGLLALAGSLVLIGVAALAFGAGLLLAVTALGAFSTVSAAAATALVTTLGIIIGGIGRLGAQIATAVATIIAAVCTAIANSVDSIVTAVGSIIISVTKALVVYLPVLLAGVAVMLASILNFLANLVPMVVDDLIKLLLIIVNSLSIAVIENGAAIGEAIKNLVASLIVFIWEALDGIFGPIIKVLFPNFYSQMQETMIAGGEGMIDVLEANNEELRAGMEKNAESMQEGWDEAISGFNPAEDVINAAEDTNETGVIDMSNIIDLDMGNITAMADELGADLPISFGESVSDNSDGATSGIEDLMSSMDLSLDGLGDLGTESGLEFDTSLADALDSGEGKVNEEAKGVAKAAKKGTSNMYSDGWSSGKDFDTGVANGIRSKVESIKSAARYVANQASSAFNNTLVIESPSKVMMRAGQYFTEGVAIGIASLSSQVEAASEGVGNDALNTMRETLRRVNEVLSGEIEPDMTIRPVVDLTGVKAGAQAINSMLSSKRYSLASDIRVPKIAVGNNQNTSNNAAQKSTEITNNFYVQRMDEGMVDYFVARVNSQLGARV